MEQSELLKNLKRLGLSVIELEAAMDIENVLTALVKSQQAQLWEGFPVVLVNAYKEVGGFDYDKLVSSLTPEQADSARSLLNLSLALYEFLNFQKPWMGELKRKLPQDKTSVSEYSESLQKNNSLVVVSGGIELNAKRLKDYFAHYLKKEEESKELLFKNEQEFSLESALSTVFSPKQKELFKRKLKGEALTKTEREYFSRTIKRKIQALANSDLNRLAQKVLGY